MAKQMTPLPDAKSVRVNPSADELKELAAKMPNARRTKYDNLNVQTEVLARSKASTFLVLDDPDSSSQQAISREEGERIAQLQDEYIADQDMIVVDGYIGERPRLPHRRAPLHRGGEREHRRHAEAALLRRSRTATGSSPS